MWVSVALSLTSSDCEEDERRVDEHEHRDEDPGRAEGHLDRDAELDKTAVGRRDRQHPSDGDCPDPARARVASVKEVVANANGAQCPG